MKLRLEENLKDSLSKLEERVKKPSFENNKGLTKIERFILLDSISVIKQGLEIEEGDSLDFSANSKQCRKQ